MGQTLPQAPRGGGQAAPSGTTVGSGQSSTHTVQFYKDEAYLADAVATFVDHGLEADEAVVVIATAPHTELFLAALQARQVATAEAIGSGQLVLRDADELIGRFTHDGLVDGERFHALIAGLVTQARAGEPHRRLRAYGEMVDVLWRRQDVAATLMLEQLWNEAIARHGVQLLCAYGLDAFSRAELSMDFDHICNEHTRVWPSDSGKRHSEAERLRALATLEQRTGVLEAEIVRRRQAEAETKALFRLTAAINRAGTLAEAYEPSLDAVLGILSVDRASILLFDPDGVMRFKAWRGLSDTYRAAVEGHSPWTAATLDPQPLLIEDVEADPAWASYRPVFRAEGIRSLGFVPLTHQGRLLGKFMIYGDAPRRFTEHEVELAQTIAAQISQAVARASLFEAEQSARLAREEVLAVVSHDLRNPLSTIVMGTAALASLDLGDKAPRVRKTTEKLQRATQRMSRLIDDLVDFASIQGGRMVIEAHPSHADDIVNATLDMFESLAQERDVRLESELPADLPAVLCDQHRAVQALTNLVSNAVKVSAPGGRVVLSASRTDRMVVFAVRDHGPGIAADELPLLFERYYRSKKSGYKGTGLGLAIAKGIIDAHGGRIWGESTVGAGSCFSFTLPVAS